jgi:hypothetical protein
MPETLVVTLKLAFAAFVMVVIAVAGRAVYDKLIARRAR